MYDNPILYTDGTAKEEDLDRIEQKFHIKIPKRCGNTIWPITVAIRKARFYGQKRRCGNTIWLITADAWKEPFLRTKTATVM